MMSQSAISRPAIQQVAAETLPSNTAQKLSPTRRRREELEFLPAALEVLETPASPVGRALSLLIALLVILTLIWGYWGRLDMVAVAQGKLIPGGHVKLVQPLGLSVVRTIYVREGQRVEAGQLLVELDSTESEVDKDQIQQALNAARMESRRLQVTWQRLNGQSATLELPVGSDPQSPQNRRLLRNQQQMLDADLGEYHAAAAELKSEARQVEAEGLAHLAQVAKLEALLPIVAEQELAFRTLMESKMGPRMRWLEVKRELIEQQQQLLVLDQQLLELDVRLQTNREQQQRLKESLRKQVAGQQLQASERMAQAQLELKSAETREGRNRLLAPVAGLVQQLNVHTQGGVVRPADTLMKIVPEGTRLEVEAVLPNKDIGFVSEGQMVEVKLESFPFTKYGLIEGRVTQLSADAVLDGRLGLVYPIRVSLSENSIQVDDRLVKLMPGMAVTAEIKIGQRRLIEFFLAPLLKYKDESLRER